MARPIVGKAYLFVICKGCRKNFRVVDDPLFEGKPVEIKGPQRLKCRGCGFEAEYAVADMQPKYFRKGAPAGA
jgi:hypothetical protein